MVSCRVNPTTPTGGDEGGGKTTGRKGKKGKAEAEEEERGEAPPRKKARTGAGTEEGAPQRKKGRAAALRDRSPEAFFASRTSPHLPLRLDRAIHAPFLLVTLVCGPHLQSPSRLPDNTLSPFMAAAQNGLCDGHSLRSVGQQSRRRGGIVQRRHDEKGAQGWRQRRSGGCRGVGAASVRLSAAPRQEDYVGGHRGYAARSSCAPNCFRVNNTHLTRSTVPYSSSGEDERTSSEQSSNALRLCRFQYLQSE